MTKDNMRVKIVVIFLLVTGVSALHYVTGQNQYYYHIFYRELYYLPIVLGGLWFGLRGGLLISLSVCFLYAPFVFMRWEGFSVSDFDKIMEIALYNIVAVILGILVDRERKNQKRLRKTERLASMGQALSAVAHDMKTPLVAIGGFSRLVQKKFQEGDPDYNMLNIVIGEISRLENMLKDMLDFSRPLVLRKTMQDINDVIKESILIVEGEARKRGVKIELMRDENHNLVAFDYMRIKQVIINLLMNAIQASPAGKIVSVSVAQNKENISLSVRDCGSGLPSGEEQIFTPFYTTKRKGTGLGLAIVKKVIQAHGGQIRIVENTNEGVTFSVILPKKIADEA